MGKGSCCQQKQIRRDVSGCQCGAAGRGAESAPEHEHIPHSSVPPVAFPCGVWEGTAVAAAVGCCSDKGSRIPGRPKDKRKRQNRGAGRATSQAHRGAGREDERETRRHRFRSRPSTTRCSSHSPTVPFRGLSSPALPFFSKFPLAHRTHHSP